MLNFNFLQFIHNLHSLTLYTFVNTFNSKDSYNLGHIFSERGTTIGLLGISS